MANDISNQLEGAVESLERFRDSLEDTNIRMGNSASIEAKVNKLEAEKAAILDKSNKAEVKRMKNLSSGMGKAAKSMGNLAMKLGVVGGILTMFKGVVDVLLKVDRHAAKFSKQLGETRKTSEGLFNEVTKVEGSLQLVGINLGEALKTAGALTQEFGQMSRVSGKMVEETAMYAKAFGVGTESAAQLTEHLTRAGKDMDFIKDGLKKSYMMGNNLGVVFRDLTKNAGMVELYLTRGNDSIIDMANRAAGLGKSLESFDKMAQAWNDLDSISDNIGKTAQLFGGEFEDGLGSLEELYRMYQNFQDPELHEKITVQLAKTVRLENNILEVRVKQQDGSMKWMRMQRAHVEQAAKLYGDDAEFMMRSLRAQKELEKLTSNQRGTLKEIAGIKGKDEKLTLDSYISLSDAYRETQKAVAKDKRIEIYELEGEQLKAAIKLAQKQLKVREDEADVATKVENILKDQAGIWEVLLNLVKGILKPLETVVSQLFDKNVMKGLREKTKEWGESIERIFSAKKGGAFDIEELNKEIEGEGGITGALGLMGNRLAAAFAAEFNLKTADDKVITSWEGLMARGWATLKPYLESAEQWLTALFGRIFKGAIEAAADESGGITKWLFGSDDDNAAPSISGGSHQAQLQSDISRLPLDQWHEYQKLQFKDPEAAAKLLEKSTTRRSLREGEFVGPYQDVGPQQEARGWAGGRHRAIVGEAGTEVGITRGALRELASAGIPGYQDGTTAVGGLLRRRGNLSQTAGGVGAQIDRHRSSAYEQQRLQNTINNFLGTQDKITQDQHNIWLQDQKEFFVKYPAVVDEAFGAGFRQSGPIATGIYNSIFSGMQAATLAELAGADKDTRRQLMYQHMTAEALKPKGLITKFMKKMASHQEDLLKQGSEITKIDRAQVALLGGIQSGLASAAGVIAGGGSKKQAKEMAKRGVVSGVLGNIAEQLGGGDQDFLNQMNTIGVLMGTMPMPSGTGRSASDMIAQAMSMTEATFQGRGRGLGWGGGNAAGRLYNSPHLAMVGEGSQNEIIIPTERIRKGLPINAGVARELGSIGVPGYQTGSADPFDAAFGELDSALADRRRRGVGEGTELMDMTEEEKQKIRADLLARRESKRRGSDDSSRRGSYDFSRRGRYDFSRRRRSRQNVGSLSPTETANNAEGPSRWDRLKSGFGRFMNPGGGGKFFGSGTPDGGALAGEEPPEVEILSSIDAATLQSLTNEQAEVEKNDARHEELSEISKDRHEKSVEGVKEGFKLGTDLAQTLYDAGTKTRWEPLLVKTR